MGIEKSNLKDLIENKETSGILPAKIIYSYPNSKKTQERFIFNNKKH